MSNRLIRSTGLVGGLTFISRITGFLRDMVAAQMFGAGMGYDAFLIAFKIPNFTRRLFAEGAFSQAFVPVLSEHRTLKNDAEVKLLVDKVAGSLGAVLLCMTFIGVALAPFVIRIFAPGFDADARFDMASTMLRITFPYAMLISLTAFASGILNAHGHFAIPAITPVILNLSMIGAVFLLSPFLSFPVQSLAWGVLIAGILQLLFQVPTLSRLHLLPRPRWDWHDSGVRKIMRLMVPSLFGASVAQINLMVDSIFASFLPVGSVSWLYYAERLIEFPLGIFGVALATVILPHLSTKHAEKSHQDFSLTLDWAFRWVMLVGIPATVALWILAEPILTALFQYGHYSPMDVMMTGRALTAMTVGLMGFLSVKILVSAFYAKQDTKFPVKIGVRVLILNVVFSAILYKPLAHAGLALASALAALLNAGWLLQELWRRQVYRPHKGWPLFMLRLLAAVGLMAALILFLSPPLEDWIEAGFKSRMLWLMGIVLGAGSLYVGVLWVFGMRRHHLRQRG